MNHPLSRLALALAAAGCALAAAAQTTLPVQPIAVPLDNTPIGTKSDFRPLDQLPSAHFDRELQEANSRAAADLATLAGRLAAPATPADCDRRVVRVGLLGDGNFTLRPGQSVVLGGCFGEAAINQVRLNGSFPGGFLSLGIQSRGPGYVQVKVPEITGVFDQPVRVQLRFADGDFSNELNGKFAAKRGLYETTSTAYIDFIRSTPHRVCSWQVCDIPPKMPNEVRVVATQPAQGTHGFKGRHPQFHLVGYYATLFGGTSQFSHWGPNGELNVDWATSPAKVSRIRFDKFVLDAPLGTVPGGVLRPPAMVNPGLAQVPR